MEPSFVRPTLKKMFRETLFSMRFVLSSPGEAVKVWIWRDLSDLDATLYASNSVRRMMGERPRKSRLWGPRVHRDRSRSRGFRCSRAQCVQVNKKIATKENYRAIWRYYCLEKMCLVIFLCLNATKKFEVWRSHLYGYRSRLTCYYVGEAHPVQVNKKSSKNKKLVSLIVRIVVKKTCCLI